MEFLDLRDGHQSIQRLRKRTPMFGLQSDDSANPITEWLEVNVGVIADDDGSSMKPFDSLRDSAG
jgi:hypothetical protein